MRRSNYTNQKYIDTSLNLITNPIIKVIRINIKLKDFLPNLVLSQVFLAKFKEEKYHLIFALFRRLKFIIREYNSFTNKLLKYGSGNKSINLHFDTVYKLEIVVLFCGQIIDTRNKLVNGKLYISGDGSIFERIYEIHNNIKHIRAEIELGGNIQSLTLDNNGFYTKNHRVEYSELRIFIVNFVKFMKILNK